MRRSRFYFIATCLLVLYLAAAGFAACSKKEKKRKPAPSSPALESYGDFQNQVAIMFGGDTSFGESYGNAIRKMLAERGYDFALTKLKPLMMSCDFSVLNLETPITTLKKSPFTGKKEYIHWTDVVKAPATLRQYKVRLISLANNHTLDYGIEGLEQTFRALHKAGIAWIGAGNNDSEALQPYVAEMSVSGVPLRIAFLTGFEYSVKYDKVYHFYARGKKGGAAKFSVDQILGQIKKLREKYPEIYIVVFPHWGGNYGWKNDKQTQWARQLLDGGADVIIGTGAHRFQELEKYNGRWIVYNLGNYVFNAPGRYAKLKSPPYGLIAQLTFENRDGKLAKALKVYPMLSDNRLTDYYPRLLEEQEFVEAYNLLAERNGDAARFAQDAPRGQDQFGRFISLPMN